MISRLEFGCNPIGTDTRVALFDNAVTVAIFLSEYAHFFILSSHLAGAWIMDIVMWCVIMLLYYIKKVNRSQMIKHNY